LLRKNRDKTIILLDDIFDDFPQNLAVTTAGFFEHKVFLFDSAPGKNLKMYLY